MMDEYINTVTQGDCLELFREVSDHSVDVTFADPPFNLKKKYRSYRDRLEFREYLDWCEKWISEMVRVTKPTGSIFVHNIPLWLTYYSEFLNEMADLALVQSNREIFMDILFFFGDNRVVQPEDLYPYLRRYRDVAVREALSNVQLVGV